MGKKASTVDWDALEPHYRAGIRSLKDIGAEFGVSDAGIIKHAREFGWTRNLKAKVQAKADAKVAEAMVRAERREEQSEQRKVTEADRVDVESEVQARIRLSHRTDIQRSKRIANRLLERLEGIEIPEAPKAGSKAEQYKAGALLVATIKDHAQVLKQLADTQRVVVNMEREAFGIADMVGANETGDTPAIDPIEGARRLAFVLNRASKLLSKGAANG